MLEPMRFAISTVSLGALINRAILVEPMGFEPTTSSMPSRRAPNCATAPPEERLKFITAEKKKSPAVPDNLRSRALQREVSGSPGMGGARYWREGRVDGTPQREYANRRSERHLLCLERRRAILAAGHDLHVHQELSQMQPDERQCEQRERK